MNMKKARLAEGRAIFSYMKLLLSTQLNRYYAALFLTSIQFWWQLEILKVKVINRDIYS
jgi:hypothetical protein